MPKKLTDPAAGMHPVHTRVAMLHLAGMSQAAIALFLGSSSEAVGHILRLPKVVQYTAALRATMITDVRRIAVELNERLEENALESLDTQIDVMRAAKNECLDPLNPDKRWEAGRLAVASAQDILNRTAPKPQVGASMEHTHRHLHVTLPVGLLDAVRSLDINEHMTQTSAIVDVTEPTSEGSVVVVEDEEVDDRQSGT
jgi:hypothetical protein